jgi:hypothetical protein
MKYGIRVLLIPGRSTTFIDKAHCRISVSPLRRDDGSIDLKTYIGEA